MSKLISADDKLGMLFREKTRKLRDCVEEQDREIEFDRLLDEVGVEVHYYDGGKRDFYEIGFDCASEAVGRQTNAVLTWSDPDEELVTIYADDEAAAEKKILELAKKLRQLVKKVKAK